MLRSSRTATAAGIAVLFGFAGLTYVLASAAAPAEAPARVEFTADGKLKQPVGYRQWVSIGTPLTPNDLNGGEAAFPEFHAVYMDPESFAHYEKTGEFREGTVLVKELISVGAHEATSGKGYFMGDFRGLEASIKDSKRFKDEPGSWAYFSFGHKYPLKAAAVKNDASSCNECHLNSAAKDFVFSQFYPVLRAAARRGENNVERGTIILTGLKAAPPMMTKLLHRPVRGRIAVATVVAAALTSIAAEPAQRPAPAAEGFSPYVTKDGAIARPVNYRETFLHLGTFAVATKANQPVDEMHNVYSRPEDIQAYRRDGKFPDGAVLVKEITRVGADKLTTGQSHWSTDIKVWFVMIKDAKGRFPGNDLWGDGWGWALFKGNEPARNVATDYETDCKSCHIPARQDDWIYVRGYPILKK